MQHAANFLSARDICAISWTCARNRAVISPRDAWHARVRARFPYKRYADRTDNGFGLRNYNPRKFILLLEDRASSGCARIFRFDRQPSWNTDTIVRGDITINSASGKQYIYDGMNWLRATREIWDAVSDVIDLTKVFSIPREFHITYFNGVACAGDMIAFTISGQSRILKISDYECTIMEFPLCRIPINADFTWDAIRKHVISNRAFVILRATIHPKSMYYHIMPFARM
jgi:hypothetical protein